MATQTFQPTVEVASVRVPLPFIDGRPVEGAGEIIAVENPATEEIIAHIRASSVAQVDAAVASARRAFDAGTWADPALRSRCIDRLADLMEEHEDELLALIIAEVGTPVSLARMLQIGVAVKHFRYAAQAALIDRTRDMGEHHDPIASHSIITYVPVGVVAAVTAYNYPLLLAAAKVGAAWAAGCTTVLLPSPQTPLATLRLVELAHEAGFPAGVLNMVVGGPDVGRALTGHPDIDKASFTGSVAVGREVMLQAARNLNDVSLELGGKSAAIVFPGVDFAGPAAAIHGRYLRNAGQGCGSPTRILVEQSRLDEFIAASQVAYAAIKVGDPWDPAAIAGPLVSAAQRARVEAYVAEALEQGGRIVAGGGRPDFPKGYYMNPTLIAGVTNAHRIAREELFGPVGVLLGYRDIDEALAIANDSELGLTASLFGPVEECKAAALRLRVGTVTINGGGGMRVDIPMTGFKNSGIGSEWGEEGVMEFLQTRHVQWPL